MAEPKIELILQDLEAALAAVSLANGDAFDWEVRRFRVGGMDQAGDIVVELKQLDDTPDEETPIGAEGHEQTVGVAIKFRQDEADATSTDTLMNRLTHEAHQAIMQDRTRGGRTVPPGTSYAGAGTLEVDEGTGRAVKELRYTLRYRHAIGDMTSG